MPTKVLMIFDFRLAPEVAEGVERPEGLSRKP